MSGAATDRLVRMANQIATEFQNQGGDAAEATRDHLWHFWDPRMRDAILAHRASGGAGLIPAASAAVERLAQGGAPEPQTRATEFGADPDGNPAADAG